MPSDVGSFDAVSPQRRYRTIAGLTQHAKQKVLRTDDPSSHPTCFIYRFPQDANGGFRKRYLNALRYALCHLNSVADVSNEGLQRACAIQKARDYFGVACQEPDGQVLGLQAMPSQFGHGLRAKNNDSRAASL